MAFAKPMQQSLPKTGQAIFSTRQFLGGDPAGAHEVIQYSNLQRSGTLFALV